MIKIQQTQYFTSLHEFHIFDLKVVGSGTFGVVKLGIHKRTAKVYAFKIINLKNFTSDQEIKILQRQIKLHSSINHPHIIKLWQSFIEDSNIYMIMEYAERGNLFTFQNQHRVFSQKQAYKLFFQTVEAVTYLHSQQIIHRDIKPQNLLLDANYNIKLSDFGWCNKLINKRNTFCGTYQYMAPEMLFGKQYDERIDLWSLGILLYQLLHGYSPFRGNGPKEVKDKMIEGSLFIDNNVSVQCREIIVSILKFDPNDRPKLNQLSKFAWAYKMQEELGNEYGLKKRNQMKISNCNPEYFGMGGQGKAKRQRAKKLKDMKIKKDENSHQVQSESNLSLKGPNLSISKQLSCQSKESFHVIKNRHRSKEGRHKRRKAEIKPTQPQTQRKKDTSECMFKHSEDQGISSCQKQNIKAQSCEKISKYTKSKKKNINRFKI